MSRKQYIVKTVNAKGFGGRRKIERMVEDGWEIHGQVTGRSVWNGQNIVTLRKPNPKWKGAGA